MRKSILRRYYKHRRFRDNCQIKSSSKQFFWKKKLIRKWKNETNQNDAAQNDRGETV